MHWLILALITSLCFALYYFFLKLASTYIHEVLGALILQIVATLTGLFLFLYLKFIAKGDFEITGKGILYACLAGVSIGLAEILSFYVYNKGIPVSIGSPVIVGSSIAFASFLGFLFLREEITIRNILAIIFIIAGIVLFTTGDKGGIH